MPEFSANEFFDKVLKMRNLQKLYFRSRGWATLADAKKAEQEVDELLFQWSIGKPFEGDTE